MPRPGSRLRPEILHGFVALVLGWCLSTSAGEVVHPSRWIAGDAAIYVEISRPTPLLDRLLDEKMRNALTALPGADGYLRSEAYRNAVAEIEGLAAKLGTTWKQGLRDLTGGGIVLAVEGESGKPARTVLIVTPSDPAVLDRFNQSILDRVREVAKSEGKEDPIKSAEYRGITGYELGEGRGAYAIIAGTLVVADRAKTLKAVADRVLDGTNAGSSLADNVAWKAKRAQVADEAQVWGLVRLDRLRELDPKRFASKGKAGPPATLLFGSWLEALRNADWASIALTWTDAGLGAELTLPAPEGGYRPALQGFIPPRGRGAARPLNPSGTMASLSLWRDLSSLWEARAELFPPEVVQGLTKLDGVAGQFFGGRDFGTGVLGALGDDWRLVVARQDHSRLNPVPAMKLPAFALVIDVKPDDDDFSQRLRVAFQSFVGLANLGGAQSKAPPLELGSESFEEVTISTARYMRPKAPLDTTEPVHPRHNFSPAVAQVENHFIVSSTVGLAQDLIHALKTPAAPQDATLLAEVDGPEVADLIAINKARLVMQNMLEKGHDKAQAEREVEVLTQLVRHLGHARLSVRDSPDAVRLSLTFDLSPSPGRPAGQGRE